MIETLHSCTVERFLRTLASSALLPYGMLVRASFARRWRHYVACAGESEG